jgi:cytochrome P450
MVSLPLLAQQVLTDNVRFSSAGYAMTTGHMGRTILQMDPPEHLRHRALVAKAFRARVLDQWSDTIIGATISELIDAFAGTSPRSSPTDGGTRAMTW